MIRKYIFNFWIWWYGAQLRTVYRQVFSAWTHMLMRLNLVPMISNFFVPMFQDQSFTGRTLSLLLRSIWIVFGGVVQIIVTIPLSGYLFVWIVLPIFCVVQIIRFFI